MAAQIRSTIGAILLTIQAQLVEKQVVPTLDRVLFWMGEDEPPFFVTEPDIVLHVLDEVPRNPNNLASGRIDCQRTRNLFVHLRTHMVTDQTQLDQETLLSQTGGHLQLEDAAYNALENFQPLDDDDNWLVACPLHLMKLTDPRRSRKHPEYFVSKLMTSIVYVRNLDLTYL